MQKYKFQLWNSSQSSNWWAFLSRQSHHITQWGTICQISMSMPTKTPFLTSPQISTRHGITQGTLNMPNTKDYNSQATEQCHRRWLTLPTLLTHTTPIYNNKMTLPQIINGQNSPHRSSLGKESNTRRHLHLPNTFRGKNRKGSGTQTVIITLNSKSLLRSMLPTQLIISHSPLGQGNGNPSEPQKLPYP